MTIDFNATAWGIPAGGFPGIPAPTPIQNEAVEVAARTWFERVTGCNWDDEPEQSKRGHRGDARVALEAAAPHILADLRAELVKLAKEFDTTTEGTLAYTATDGRFQMRKNAHDQLMYIVDSHSGAAK